MFTVDGAVIPFGIPVGGMGSNHTNRFGLRRGYVQKAVYPDDPKNITGALEYVVLINKVVYSGVLDVSGSGGIRNNHVKVRSGIERPGLDKDPNEEDGDHVWCLFVGGDGDIPIIIGSAQHQRVTENKDYKKPKKSDGEFERYEYNGIEFLTDKDGSHSISIVGNKQGSPPPGFPARNPEAVGTKIKVWSTGQVEVVSKGTKGIIVNSDAAVAVKSAKQVTAEGAGGAKLKLNNGKVGLGKAGGDELLDLVVKGFMEVLGFLQEIQQETHIGNLGYATAVPTNTPNYIKIHSNLMAIKQQIQAIQGGIS